MRSGGSSLRTWWRPNRPPAYKPGWLAKSGAPHRMVIDGGGVVHFMLSEPWTPRELDMHPGVTGCDHEFQWKDTFVEGFEREPEVMNRARAPLHEVTCVLCLGAF